MGERPAEAARTSSISEEARGAALDLSAGMRAYWRWVGRILRNPYTAYERFSFNQPGQLRVALTYYIYGLGTFVGVNALVTLFMKREARIPFSGFYTLMWLEATITYTVFFIVIAWALNRGSVPLRRSLVMHAVFCGAFFPISGTLVTVGIALFAALIQPDIFRLFVPGLVAWLSSLPGGLPITAGILANIVVWSIVIPLHVYFVWGRRMLGLSMTIVVASWLLANVAYMFWPKPVTTAVLEYTGGVRIVGTEGGAAVRELD